tara:strand:+ start:2222 stop:2674 length:453 start_codon:yes stop_codon:yes gene_type:complete
MDINYRAISSEDDWKWLYDRAKPVLTPNTTGIVCFDRVKMQIVAMCAFDNWTETSVQMHMAIDNPMILRHGLLEEISQYVYRDAGRDIILATVPADNEKALKLNTHIGMSVVHTIKDGFKRGVDYHLLELRKADCKWWKPEMMELKENVN